MPTPATKSDLRAAGRAAAASRRLTQDEADRVVALLMPVRHLVWAPLTDDTERGAA